MSFDDDVLSALQEAFGADSASLIDDLDLGSSGEETAEEVQCERSLDDLVAAIDQQIVAAAGTQIPGEKPQRRSRSIEDKHVLVLLGEASYGLPMKNVQEIQQPQKITYLPHLPEWIPGVCNLRGNIVSLVDLKQLLGFEPTVIGPRTRLVVVRTESQDLTTGLIVDEVVRITEVETGRVRKPTGSLKGQLGAFLKGTYETVDDVIGMIDLETLLNSPTLRSF